MVPRGNGTARQGFNVRGAVGGLGNKKHHGRFIQAGVSCRLVCVATTCPGPAQARPIATGFGRTKPVGFPHRAPGRSVAATRRERDSSTPYGERVLFGSSMMGRVSGTNHRLRLPSPPSDSSSAHSARHRRVSPRHVSGEGGGKRPGMGRLRVGEVARSRYAGQARAEPGRKKSVEMDVARPVLDVNGSGPPPPPSPARFARADGLAASGGLGSVWAEEPAPIRRGHDAGGDQTTERGRERQREASEGERGKPQPRLPRARARGAVCLIHCPPPTYRRGGTSHGRTDDASAGGGEAAGDTGDAMCVPTHPLPRFLPTAPAGQETTTGERRPRQASVAHDRRALVTPPTGPKLPGQHAKTRQQQRGTCPIAGEGWPIGHARPARPPTGSGRFGSGWAYIKAHGANSGRGRPCGYLEGVRGAAPSGRRPPVCSRRRAWLVGAARSRRQPDGNGPACASPVAASLACDCHQRVVGARMPPRPRHPGGPREAGTGNG